MFKKSFAQINADEKGMRFVYSLCTRRIGADIRADLAHYSREYVENLLAYAEEHGNPRVEKILRSIIAGK